MKWEEYQKIRSATLNLSEWEITEIECPECGMPVYRNKEIVLTMYPALYWYKCHDCGWSDTAH